MSHEVFGGVEDVDVASTKSPLTERVSHHLPAPQWFPGAASTRSPLTKRVSRARCRAGRPQSPCFNEVAPYGASVTVWSFSATMDMRAASTKSPLRSECHGLEFLRHDGHARSFNEVAPTERVSLAVVGIELDQRLASTKSPLTERVSQKRQQIPPLTELLQRSRPLRSECHGWRRSCSRRAPCFNEVAPYGASVTLMPG